jgi:hypothetical protein
MPYKNPEDKRQWEREHRKERNARRRKQYFAPRAAPTVQKRPHDPISAQEPKHGWKPILGFAVGLGVVLLAAFAGLNLPDTGNLGPKATI